MKYAKIVNNVVTQIQPNSQAGFIKVDNNVVCGMVEDNGTFTNPPETLEQAKATKLNQIELDYNTTDSEPITLNGTIYFGGSESAKSIRDYVDGNRLEGITTHNIWDINGTEKSHTDAEAKAVVIAIGDASSVNDFNKKNRKVALAIASTILEVEAV